MVPKISIDTANLQASDEGDNPSSPEVSSIGIQQSSTTLLRSEKASHLAVPRAIHSGQRSSDASSNGGWDAMTATELEKSKIDVTQHAKSVIDSNTTEDTGPFAFSNTQLQSLVDPKELEILRQLGGLKGLAKGLQTDILAGLSADETALPIQVSLAEAQAADKSEVNEEPSQKAIPLPITRRTTIGRINATLTTRSTIKVGEDKMLARRQIYGKNVLPARKTKNIFQLMWIALQDKVLIILSVAAVVSLALGIYETVDGPPELDPYTQKPIPHVEWVEGVAIIIAIAIVTIVGSANDYQKERQFAKLNQKVSFVSSHLV